MDTNLKELLELREKALEKIEDNLKSWDGSLEEGLEISELNGTNFQELENLDGILKNLSHPFIYSEEYLNKLNSIMGQYEKLMNYLKDNQMDLLEKMKEINKRDEIIDSYINKEIESIFIDKDL